MPQSPRCVLITTTYVPNIPHRRTPTTTYLGSVHEPSGGGRDLLGKVDQIGLRLVADIHVARDDLEQVANVAPHSTRRRDEVLRLRLVVRVHSLHCAPREHVFDTNSGRVSLALAETILLSGTTDTQASLGGNMD